MQGFTAFVAVALLVATVAASGGYGGGSSSGGYGGSGGSSSGGYGGGSSGGQSIPAPPCPRNYLFSCQPSLQQAPCAPQAAAPSGGYGGGSAPSGGYGGSAPAPAPAAGGYGSSGSYSENIPTYVAAPYNFGYMNGLQGLVGGYQGIQY